MITSLSHACSATKLHFGDGIVKRAISTEEESLWVWHIVQKEMSIGRVVGI